MRFSNPLVSFVATIALVSSATASATPVRRGGEPSTDSNCNGGTLQCCQSSTILSDAPENIISSLLSILPDVDADTPIGLDCILDGVEGWYSTPQFRIKLYA